MAAILLITMFLAKASRASMVTLAIIIVVEAGVLWRVLGGLAATNVVLTDEALIYTDRKGTTTIPYEDITSLEFPSVKYTGGWIKINTASKPIRLTVVVQGIHRLLLELKQQLDRRGLSHKYNEKKFFSFIKTSAYSDHSWDRFYRIWAFVIGTPVLTGLIGGITAAGLHLNRYQRMTLLLPIIMFPLVPYIIAEFILGKRTTQQSNLDEFYIPEPDLAYENKVYLNALIWGCVGFAALLGFVIIRFR